MVDQIDDVEIALVNFAKTYKLPLRRSLNTFLWNINKSKGSQYAVQDAPAAGMIG